MPSSRSRGPGVEFERIKQKRPDSLDAYDHTLRGLAAMNNLTPGDIDWLVPHQANLRIIESMAHRLNLPQDRVAVTVDRHANTSAASIPLALSEAVGDGRIREGDLVLMEAMGGGFTWGSALVRW